MSARNFAEQSALIDIELKRQDLALREREQRNRDDEIELRRKELETSKWRSPLVVAICAASLAALGNAAVSIVNGSNQRDLEEFKAESERVLEVIKTGGNPEKAAENLKFLLDTELVREPERVASIKLYLQNRTPGSGVSLPTDAGTYQLGSDPRIPATTQKLASDRLSAFRQYLKQHGLNSKFSDVDVKIIEQGGPINAYFDGVSQINVHPKIIEDDVVIIHEFMLYVLQKENKKAFSTSWQSIGYGLSDYLPSSFLDRPQGGEIVARVLSLPKPYLYKLDNELSYEEISSGRRTDQHEVAEVWGGAFWALRAKIGQGATDRMLLTVWRKMSGKGTDAQVVTEFLITLKQQAKTMLSAEDYSKFVTIMADRKFPSFS